MQSKTSLLQFMSIASNFPAKHQCLQLLVYFLADIGSNTAVRVSPKPLLQTGKAQIPWPLLTGRIFLPLPAPPQLSQWPSFHASFKFINQGFQNCRVFIGLSFTIAEERWIISSLNLLAVILLIQVNMLVGFFAVRAQHSFSYCRTRPCKTCSSSASQSPACTCPFQAQDFAFFHAEAQEIPAGPFLYLVQGSLHVSTALKNIDCILKVGIICKPVEDGWSSPAHQQYTPTQCSSKVSPIYAIIKFLLQLFVLCILTCGRKFGRGVSLGGGMNCGTFMG